MQHLWAFKIELSLAICNQTNQFQTKIKTGQEAIFETLRLLTAFLPIYVFFLKNHEKICTKEKPKVKLLGGFIWLTWISVSKVSMEFEIVVKCWAVLKCPTSNAGDLFNKVIKWQTLSSFSTLTLSHCPSLIVLINILLEGTFSHSCLPTLYKWTTRWSLYLDFCDVSKPR